jgi:hypothetical protein
MMSRIGSCTLLAVLVLGFALTSDHKASAQFPNWKAHPVRPIIDVIPPLGNNLPLSYRARMNRPSYLSGRIAYTIEPSSQEAMAWQRAWERGYYANHAPRMETHYIYPKPWEVLGVGAKPKRGNDAKAGFAPPERSPLVPLTDEMPPVTPEQLDPPPGESEAAVEPISSPPVLLPRVRTDTRPQPKGPSTLELAPAIELPSNLQVK